MKSPAGKRLQKLLPMQRKDFAGLFEAMDGYPGGDPHARSAAARVPSQARRPDGRSRPPAALDRRADEKGDVAEKYSIPGGRSQEAPAGVAAIASKSCTNSIPCWAIAAAAWASPIPRSRKCRPARSSRPRCRWPRRSIKVIPEVMIPLVGSAKELENQKEIVVRVANEVLEKAGMKRPALYGGHHDRDPARRRHRRSDRATRPNSSASAPTISRRPPWVFPATTIRSSRSEYENLKIFKADPFAIDRSGGRGQDDRDGHQARPRPPARISKSASAASTAAIRLRSSSAIAWA